MFNSRGLGLSLIAAVAFAGNACGSSNFGDSSHEAGSPTDATPTEGGAHDSGPRDTGVSTVPLLLAVEPDHGPFTGGNQVTLRGSNLSASLMVRFGTSLVQPRDEMMVDSHRLVVLTPSGQPGTVDVSIDDGAHHSTLPQAYTYDAFYADPNSGSVAGGTLITLHGSNTNWTSATTVIIDSTPCTNITVVGPAQITCTVPAHSQGNVPITVTTGTDAITVANAFQYYDGADTHTGGFGGGHISGNINITVLNLLNGTPIPGAYVWVGNDPTVPPPLSGIANGSGEVTLASPTLMGPVTVTASAHCFASSSFVDIDGRDGTIELIPWLGMVPGVDCGPPHPPPPGGAPVYAAQIDGELVWAGPREFGPNPWFNVPEPLANEQRIAFVMTTQDTIRGQNPDPGMGGTVLEVIPPSYGGRGYAYSIVARPTALAVYAIAGLQTTNTAPPRFTPYVMGVARGVLASPRAHHTMVDIDMNIPLDHETQVTMHNVPPQLSTGQPSTFTVEGWIDLGGEGVIPRPDLTVRGHSSSDPYVLAAMPAFDGNLSDARMIVRDTYGSGASFQDPESTVIVGGIETPDMVVDVNHWVGIPVLTSPMDGGSIPPSRQITFNQGGNNPDFFWTVISTTGSSCHNGFYLGDVVWWQHHFPSMDRNFYVPDISSIPGLTDMPRGLYDLSICAIDVPGFDFNQFRYQFLSQYYWTAYASNAMTLAR
jgi:hypothetical protein